MSTVLSLRLQRKFTDTGLEKRRDERAGLISNNKDLILGIDLPFWVLLIWKVRPRGEGQPGKLLREDNKEKMIVKYHCDGTRSISLNANPWWRRRKDKP